jgi:hypothetical protein
MAFWSQASSEPRRAHRFLLSLPLLGEEGYTEYLAKTVTKPSYTIGETEHKFLGNTYYYPGAVTWESVSAQLVNAVDPDGNKILFDALYKSGYMDPKDQEAFFNGAEGSQAGTPNKLNSLGALGNVLIREINGEGTTIGTWQLNNPWITNVKFGDLDYGSEDLLNIDITFRYDWAWYGPGTSAPGPGLDDDPTREETVGG